MVEPCVQMLHPVFLVGLWQVHAQVFFSWYIRPLGGFLLSLSFVRDERYKVEAVLYLFNMKILVSGRGYARNLQIPPFKLFQDTYLGIPLQAIFIYPDLFLVDKDRNCLFCNSSGEFHVTTACIDS